MVKYCDLHTHSLYSDGTCSPRELIHLAEEKGLAALVLSDHNTVAGLPEFLEAARHSPVEAVPGIEFSTEYGGTELHILGLFLQPEFYGAISERMDALLEAKDRSNRQLVQALNGIGLPLDYDAIKERTAGGQVNRAVIGAEIVRLGYADSVKDAFCRYLFVGCGYYRPPRRPDALETLGFIKSIGAVAVLAHPFLNLKTEDRLRSFLKEGVEAGLSGMEVQYPLFDEQTRILAKNIADEFGLLPSGGSDFHGENKPGICLGTGKGDLRVPAEYLENLKKCRS